MSSSVDYNVYRQEIINFLQTVTIKFSLFSEYAKVTLQKNGISTDTLDDHENPYYLNLSGLYSNIDKPIYITVLETGKEEILTKELLQKYPKTKEVYRIPNIEYDNLLAAYPDKQGLIKSIIYPANIKQNSTTVGDITQESNRTLVDYVVNARDLSLLGYDDSLLEEDEKHSLIEALENFLNYTYHRWFVKDFHYEPAYAVVFMGLIWSVLPSVLLTQRVKNLRTPQVHSMHVWEYLDSKGLGEYKSILTRKQSLFLYRNIDYLIHNKGKKTNIEILAQNLLEGLHLNLVGKTILLETNSATISESIDALLGEVDVALKTGNPNGLSAAAKEYYDQLKIYEGNPEEINKQISILRENVLKSATECQPHPEFLSDDIASRKTIEQIDESHKESMDSILSRIYDEGYYPDYSSDNSKYMDNKFGLSKSNSISTRIIEFEKALLNTRYLHFLTEFMVDSLFYHYYLGNLNYTVKFNDPYTGNPFVLTMGDTLTLLYYIHHKATGTEPSVIPVRYTTRICYHNRLPDKLPDNWKHHGFIYKLKSFINTEQILKDIVFDNGPFKDNTEFMERLANQFGSLVKHTQQVRESSNTRYQEAMLYYYNHLVVHRTLALSLSSFPDYSSWLAVHEDISELVKLYDDLGSVDYEGITLDRSREYYQKLCDTIWSALFPVSDIRAFDDYVSDNKDSSNITTGIKKLFTQLCSYRLLFLDTDRINGTFIVAPYTSLYTKEAIDKYTSRLEIDAYATMDTKDHDSINIDLLLGLSNSEIFKDHESIYVNDNTTLDCSNFKDTNTLIEVSTMSQSFVKEKEAQKIIANTGVSSVTLSKAN